MNSCRIPARRNQSGRFGDPTGRDADRPCLHFQRAGREIQACAMGVVRRFARKDRALCTDSRRRSGVPAVWKAHVGRSSARRDHFRPDRRRRWLRGTGEARCPPVPGGSRKREVLVEIHEATLRVSVTVDRNASGNVAGAAIGTAGASGAVRTESSALWSGVRSRPC